MIKLEQLTKTYPGGKGIKNLCLQIEPGEAFGFLGPNGAGKTTTIRILMGFLQPDSGEARIKGLDSWRKRTEVKRIVSYLPGELRFLENLSGQEFLELLISMHGERTELKLNWQRLAERLSFNARQPIRKMSKGMKQKLGIIAALMLDAEVLILDEPTSGLDPLMQKVFIDLILEEKRKGKTIFMSSHQFAEIERTCEQVGVIRAGELLSVQAISQLKQKELRTFEVEVENEESAELLRQSGLTINQENGLRFIIQASGKLDLLWKTLAEVQVKEFRQRSLQLEEAFMQYYR